MTALAGARAPDTTLTTLDGLPIQRAQAWQAGQPAQLIFLRHLGWLPCREHVAQLCQHWESFRPFNVNAIVITFGAAPLARAWLTRTGAPFALWLDPARTAYRAYVLDHSLVRSWGPKTIVTYARLLLSRRRWRGIQGDSAQLGGDFVVDASGLLRFAYRSRDPSDRPGVGELLDTFRRLDGRSTVVQDNQGDIGRTS